MRCVLSLLLVVLALERSVAFQPFLRTRRRVDVVVVAAAKMLECDADQVETMNVALWNILADLSKDHNNTRRICLSFPNVPVSALSSFANDFQNVLLEPRLIKHLPELERMRVSLDDNHPSALILETTRKEEPDNNNNHLLFIDKANCTAALKQFVDKVVIGLGACPYTATPILSATGLEKRGVPAGPVAYRFCGDHNACAAMASFWTSVLELLSTPQGEISTTLLSLPAIGAGLGPEDHDRFAAVVEWMSRNLCLFRGDAAVGLVHFHPAYTRHKIVPVNKPAFGHLPPQSWLRPMLRHNGNAHAADTLSEQDLFCSNYQRRAPHTMINILRASQLNAATGAKSIVDLQIDDKNTTEKASGIPLYSKNAIRLAEQGQETLDAAMEAIWEQWG